VNNRLQRHDREAFAHCRLTVEYQATRRPDAGVDKRSQTVANDPAAIFIAEARYFPGHAGLDGTQHNGGASTFDIGRVINKNPYVSVAGAYYVAVLKHARRSGWCFDVGHQIDTGNDGRQPLKPYGCRQANEFGRRMFIDVPVEQLPAGRADVFFETA
jgi:hypothetical protein